MLSRKLLNVVLSMLVISSLLFGGVAPVRASTQATQSLPAQKAAVANPTDQTKVPHYFGPYPNWANSPQVLTDAIVTINSADPAGPVGNLLVTGATDTDASATFVINNTPLPSGSISAFKIFAQAAAPGYTFNAYVLRPTVNPNEYQVIFVSPTFTTTLTGAVETFTLAAPVAVLNGDLIAHYGQGIAFTSTGGTDTTLSSVNPVPALGGLFTVGSVDYPVNAGVASTYSFAAVVTPGGGAEAVAKVDPKTGGISAITVTSPGSDYGVVPNVVITSPGVTPTTLANATAEIGLGVLTSVTVVETGFGFTNPTVTVTGGNPTTAASVIASGGVDNVIIVDGGSGYTPNAYVEFGPSPSGQPQSTATGSLVLDGNGTIIGITVNNPGFGYTAAPPVTIFEPTSGSPTTVASGVTATIGVNQIDIAPGGGGLGYKSTPTLTITDGPGGPDLGATATATIATLGAVTKVNVTTAGAGYLTPGLKKFVDDLPGLCNPATGVGCSASKYIPLGVPDTTTYPGSDYYEIAVVQYRMQFSSQLPPTLLRGYVQLDTNVIPGNGVALSNAMLSGPDVPINGYKGVTPPHYLGPTIIATKNRPVRILFRNLLPTGVDGNLFLPVDTTLMGAGMGPNMVTLDANGVPNNMPMGDTPGTVTDDVRNPACGETPKPADCFSENRATLHLHGGITPWISDGTPHQWTTPAGEGTSYPKGVSVKNVPDMPDPGDGAITFFYTNQQSARLMFYHDHAWGITRLNVYAGEAAGYLITDDTEKKLFGSTGLFPTLGTGTPLIIQDKTFVSDNILQQDPTWDKSRWGGTRSLWSPHVYMPAQNPGDPSGMSSFGRWMYGPWFWPPAKDAKFPPIANPYYNMDPATNFTTPLAVPCNLDDPATWQYQSDPFCEPPTIPSTPNLSVGMEAFNDTPLVNGTAYPKTTVEPKAYRYRILNAANDRFWNLSWYVADPSTGTLSEVALNKAEVAAAQLDPNVFPTPDTTLSPAGPNWIQIGTEGGFLPAPVVVPAHPTTWIIDPTRFDVGNVDQHSLLLAPAERADVIVDFSQFRGKTLILYNDAPAAFPARVSSYDYYTGGPDLSPAGAPSTLPGYGPNTRTIMKVTVSNAAPATAFDRPNTTNDGLGQLVAAFAHHADGSGVFESGQNPIIVGQSAYNSAYGSNFASGSWCNSPATTRCDGMARIQEGSQPGDLFGFNTLAAPNAKMQIPFQPKAIHDEMNSASFDEWGRMTANLGLEAPGATPLTQNIILYPYVNPATEVLDATGLPSSLNVTPISSAADGTQIWKITHNGVDTHPIHFHLYDVQVINRVTWDNIIIPTEPSELGWKDTVRVSPLEDTIVAVRPIVPVLPFAIPDSWRLLNPMMPEGATGDPNSTFGYEAGFNSVDPSGNANTWNTPTGMIYNEMTNFGWEYVFHCHILSHEEMDMMRPVTVHVARTLADSPVLGVTRVSGTSVNLSWTDGTPVDYNLPASLVNNWGNSKNEIGFRIERAPITGGVTGAYAEIGTALANQTSFSDTAANNTIGYSYRVTAFNAAGDSPSAVVSIAPPPTVVSIVRTSATNPTNASTVSFTVTFSESVTGVNGADFSLTNTGSIAGTSILGVTGSGATRTVTVNTGTGDGTIRLDLIDDDSIVNAVGVPLGGTGIGNGNFTTGQTYTLDKTSPTVVSIVRTSATNPTTVSTVSFTVTFSESVTGVNGPDFRLTNTGTIAGASILGVTGSGTTRTVTVNTGTGDGTIRLDLIDDDSILDAVGNRLGGTGIGNGNFTTGQTYTLDRTPPTVISIVRTSATNPTNASQVSFTVTFSESVTGVNGPDFRLTNTGTIAGTSILGVTGSGTTRTVTISTGTGSGTIRLDLIDDDSIIDAVSNRLGGTGIGNGNFTTGQFYTVR